MSTTTTTPPEAKQVEEKQPESKPNEQQQQTELVKLNKEDDLFDSEILSKLDYGDLKANPKTLADNLVLRPLNKLDYRRGYLELLKQLTSVGEVSEQQFNRQFDLMRNCLNTYFIIVIEDERQNKIIGSATLQVEYKFIHQTSLRGRIEDVVVDDANRGKQLGKILLETVKLLARHVGCYKLSLDCKDNMISYYNSLQFICEPGNSNTMIIRFWSFCCWVLLILLPVSIFDFSWTNFEAVNYTELSFLSQLPWDHFGFTYTLVDEFVNTIKKFDFLLI